MPARALQINTPTWHHPAPGRRPGPRVLDARAAETALRQQDDPGYEPGWVKLPGGAWIEECNLDDLFGPSCPRGAGVEQASGSAWE